MLINSSDYFTVVADIKLQIHNARHKAALSANSELVILYWRIGKAINEHSVWGSKFVENLSRDIKLEFPRATGYSIRNLKYMAQFAKSYPDIEIVQTLSAQLPWSHNIALLDKVKDNDERLWYIQETIGRKCHQSLVGAWRRFCFRRDQYHIEVEGEDFYIDLLFYHLKLRCFVVVELKTGTFKPEYTGKLNFYVSAIDDLLKTATDNPTIGLLLCRDKKRMIAEYSLKDIEKPIGVSEYKLLDTLPAEYESLLPTAEDIMSRIDIEESSKS